MSKIDYSKLARKAVQNSFIMEGREGIKFADLMQRYPNGITATGYEWRQFVDSETGQVNEYYVVRIAEDNNVYFNTPTSLTRVFDSFVDEYKFLNDISEDTELSYETLSDDLLESGGIKFNATLMRKRSKPSETFWRVNILS